MGLIGDLIYPNNASDARKLNREQVTLQKTNELHNDLVNAYASLAEEIRTFDTYLMAILVLQYHMTYTKEDLDDLPDAKSPKITQSLASKIETLALDALSIKMGYSGIKAIGRKIANVVKESGSYKESISEGQDAVAENLQPELENVASQSDIARSGNVDILTDTDASVEELGDMAEELQGMAEDLGEFSEIGEEGADLTETFDAAFDGASAALEAGEAAAEAGEAAAEAGVEATAAGAGAGMAAFLGPAAVILIVVTEIFEIINAAETHEKLEKALDQMRKMQTQSDKSLARIKKAFKSLLTCAKLDLKTYNKVLKKLYQLEGNKVYDISFKTKGIEAFLNGMATLSIHDNSGINAYKSGVMNDLAPAKAAIRKQAQHDAGMTDVIMKIKTHIRHTGNMAFGEDYLESLSDVTGIDLSRVKTYNTFRQYIAEFAAVLKPYHKQVQEQTPAGAKLPVKPDHPDFGKPDPNFDPKPSDFEIPGAK
jgi:hypothetical protein